MTGGTRERCRRGTPGPGARTNHDGRCRLTLHVQQVVELRSSQLGRRVEPAPGAGHETRRRDEPSARRTGLQLAFSHPRPPSLRKTGAPHMTNLFLLDLKYSCASGGSLVKN